MDDYNLPYLFKLPKRESEKSVHFRPMGAVITRRGIPISWGFNKLKTHPIFANGKEFYTIHAEMDALLQCQTSILGATIWIYRETREGKIAMAKPCKYCLQHLIEVGIRKIFYTIPTYPFYEEIIL